MTAVIVLTGCASAPRIAKDIPVAPVVQEQARNELAIEAGLQRAAYEQAQRMAAQNYCSPVRPYEPFGLMTTGHVDSNLSDELRAAYAKLGVDHRARVVWVDSTVSPNLKVGDVVTKINGRDIEPDVPYFLHYATRKGRYDLKVGESLDVKLEDGRSVKIVGKAGCEAGVLSSYFDLNPHQMGFDITPMVKLPTNLLRQAQDEWDLRWLAAFAMYITSTPEAESRKTKAQMGASVGLVGHVVLAIVPGGSWLSNQTVQKSILYFGLDGIYETAAEFATREVHALGGDPSRGVEMFARAYEQKLQVGLIEFTPEQLDKVRKLALDLSAGTALAPSYALPKKQVAVQ